MLTGWRIALWLADSQADSLLIGLPMTLKHCHSAVCEKTVCCALVG